MLAKDLVSDSIPRVMTSNTGAQALSWMEHFRVSHLPVVNEADFLGLISDADISTLTNPDEPIGNHNLSLFSPFVFLDQHLYEVAEIMARLNLSVVPVLNPQKSYAGCITQQEMIGAFARLAGVDQPGAVIILNMTIHDYSLFEISRLVEENGAKILSLFASTSPETMRLELTIKVNTTDLTSINRSLERYGYEISASFSHEDAMEELYRSRFDEFMRYLNT